MTTAIPEANSLNDIIKEFYQRRRGEEEGLEVDLSGAISVEGEESGVDEVLVIHAHNLHRTIEIFNKR